MTAKKPPRTHLLAPYARHVQDDVHVMICGMRSIPERPLIFTTTRTLADCHRARRGPEEAVKKHRDPLARAATLARYASDLLWEAGRHLRGPRWNTVGVPLHDASRRINFDLCTASDKTEKLANDLDSLIRSLKASPPVANASQQGLSSSP